MMQVFGCLLILLPTLDYLGDAFFNTVSPAPGPGLFYTRMEIVAKLYSEFGKKIEINHAPGIFFKNKLIKI